MDEVITEEIAKRGHTNSNHVRMGWIEREKIIPHHSHKSKGPLLKSKDSISAAPC